jgi:hypothetical protein
VELSTAALLLTGRSGPVAPPLDLAVGSGEVVVAGIGSAVARTATGLALTGQLQSWSGRVSLDGAPVSSARGRAGLRARSALVDPADPADAVGGLPVAAVVSEQLAAAGVRAPGGTGAWLAGPELAGPELAGPELAGRARDRLGDLPAAARTWLLTALGLARPHVGLVVLDSPDRHDGSSDWLDGCVAAAVGGAAVLVLCAVPTAASLRAARPPGVRLLDTDPSSPATGTTTTSRRSA